MSTEAFIRIHRDGRVETAPDEAALGAMLAEGEALHRQLRPDLAVVYTSGRWGTAEQFPTVPGSHFLPKPYDPDEVCAVLRRLLAAREHPASRLSLA